jgi:hypothetical protein
MRAILWVEKFKVQGFPCALRTLPLLPLCVFAALRDPLFFFGGAFQD